jgi:hypothetical protein
MNEVSSKNWTVQGYVKLFWALGLGGEYPNKNFSEKKSVYSPLKFWPTFSGVNHASRSHLTDYSQFQYFQRRKKILILISVDYPIFSALHKNLFGKSLWFFNKSVTTTDFKMRKTTFSI